MQRANNIIQAFEPHCPNPECPGPVGTRTLSLLADPSRHPLGRVLGRFAVSGGNRNPASALGVYALALVLSPLVFMTFGWWALPIVVLILPAFLMQGIYLLAAPSSGNLQLATYTCRKCHYRWVKRVSPPESYLAKMEYELPRARKRGKVDYLAAILSDLGGLLVMHRGAVSSALPLAQESLSIRRGRSDKRGLAYTLNNYAFALLYAGGYSPGVGEARGFAEESLSLFRDLRDWRGIACAANTLAEALISSGEIDRAAHLLSESLALKWRMADEELIAWDLESLAQVAALRQEWVRVARLLAAAQRLREMANVTRPPVTLPGVLSALDAARGSLGEVPFANAWAEGRHMTPDQACDYALNARDVVPVTLPAFQG